FGQQLDKTPKATYFGLGRSENPCPDSELRRAQCCQGEEIDQSVNLATNDLTYPSDRPGVPDGDSFNYPLFERLRDASREKIELFGVSWPRPRDVTLGNSTEKIRVQFVSGDALAILGVKSALGRLLNAEDDRYPGESPVAVVSYEFWMRKGGHPDILSQLLDYVEPSSTTRTKNTKRRLQIVGVVQRGFTGVEPG